MFNFNCIQNAIINANAGFQAVVVVGRANAHRVSPTTKPCGTYPVAKCLERMYMPKSDSPGSSLRTRGSGWVSLADSGSMHPASSDRHGSWRQKRCLKNGSMSGRNMRSVSTTISG